MRKLVTILLLFQAVCLSAQDIHFSQFYASPLTLNPSLTGNFDGLVRFGANYRNQWNSVSVPYQTFSAFADVNMLRDAWQGGWLGAGFVAVYDNAGNGPFVTNKIGLSMAVHKALNKHKNLYLSFGVTGFYIHKKVDYSNLLFDSQWNDVGFDSNIDPGENYISSSVNYFDLQLGVSLLYFIEKKFRIRGGFSLAHVTEPQESFYNYSNYLHRRPVTHLYTDFRLGEYFGIQPGFVHMYQRKAQELIFGSNFTYDLKYRRHERLRLFAGIWYRNKDAVFPLAGMEMYNTRLLFNYDINLSKLVPGSHSRGGFEISIVHVLDKKRPVNPVRYCPRF